MIRSKLTLNTVMLLKTNKNNMQKQKGILHVASVLGGGLCGTPFHCSFWTHPPCVVLHACSCESCCQCSYNCIDSQFDVGLEVRLRCHGQGYIWFPLQYCTLTFSPWGWVGVVCRCLVPAVKIFRIQMSSAANLCLNLFWRGSAPHESEVFPRLIHGVVPPIKS